jgi:hypothetical protein
VCLLEYDKEDWLDIYLVNGSTYDSLDGKATAPHSALLYNNYDGTFTDVTQPADLLRWICGALHIYLPHWIISMPDRPCFHQQRLRGKGGPESIGIEGRSGTQVFA